MSSPKKPLEINDFSGGITDNIIQGSPNRAAKLDNYLITTDKKLEERPAYKKPDSVINPLPAGLNKLNGLFSVINGDYLIAQSGRDMFAHSGKPDTLWQTILGVSGNPALSSGDVNSQTSMAEINGQLILANDSGGLTSKLYRDENDQYVS